LTNLTPFLSTDRYYTIELNKKLVSLHNVSELTGFIREQVGNFNLVNCATAMHRLAKVRMFAYFFIIFFPLYVKLWVQPYSAVGLDRPIGNLQRFRFRLTRLLFGIEYFEFLRFSTAKSKRFWCWRKKLRVFNVWFSHREKSRRDFSLVFNVENVLQNQTRQWEKKRRVTVLCNPLV
jgi:hypothetical protein